MVCALAAETKEAEYLAMIERHKAGKTGKRGCDLMGQMFGELVAAMDTTDADIIGDLFVGAISYGEAGRYFTPESLTRLLAQKTVDPDARPEVGKPILVNDPCCGTGRMLLEASTINPHVEQIPAAHAWRASGARCLTGFERHQTPNPAPHLTAAAIRHLRVHALRAVAAGERGR